MPEYSITVYNDMGHLLIKEWDNIPRHIRDFVYAKANIYLKNATDNSNLGCAFYILKDGLQTRWRYTYGRDIINIFWNVDIFDSNTMKYVIPIYKKEKYENYPLFI